MLGCLCSYVSKHKSFSVRGMFWVFTGILLYHLFTYLFTWHTYYVPVLWQEYGKKNVEERWGNFSILNEWRDKATLSFLVIFLVSLQHRTRIITDTDGEPKCTWLSMPYFGMSDLSLYYRWRGNQIHFEQMSIMYYWISLDTPSDRSMKGVMRGCETANKYILGDHCPIQDERWERPQSRLEKWGFTKMLSYGT